MDCGLSRVFHSRKKSKAPEIKATAPHEPEVEDKATPKLKTASKTKAENTSPISGGLKNSKLVLPIANSQATSTENADDKKEPVGEQKIAEYKRNIKMKRDEMCAINDKRLEIHAERQSLQKRAFELLRDFNTTDEDLEYKITAYSQAWHLHFTAIMLVKLPLELRRLIYDFLVLDFPSERLTLEKSAKDHSPFGILPQAVLEHPCLLPSYVGPSIAEEFAKHVYESCTFLAKSLAVAAWLLRHDLFNLGISPKLHLRRLLVYVYHEDQSRDVFTMLPTLDPKALAFLQKFQTIKMKSTFKLTFLVVSVTSKQRTRNVLLALGSWVYRFKKAGMEVRTSSWRDKWNESTQETSQDYSAVFGDDVAASRERIEGFTNWSDIAIDRSLTDVLRQVTPAT